MDYEDRPRPKRNTHIRAILQQVYHLVGYKNLTPRQKAIISLLVRDTIRLGTIAWGTEQAKAWGKNWQFDHVRLIADAAYIAHHGGMTGASRARWDELSANRLTEERVHEHLDEMNPYFEQVKELSKRGILQPGAQEAVYIYQSSLVHADGLSASDDSLNEAEKKESTNTFTTSQNPTLYYMDEISGELRTIFPSDIHYNQPLNSDALQEWARHRWGHKRHPTIEDFVRIIADNRGSRTTRSHKDTEASG